MKTEIATLALVALFATACSSGESVEPETTTQPASECKPLKKSQLKAIAEGLTSKTYHLAEGATLPLPKDSQAFGMRKIVAVRVVGAGDDGAVLLAMGKDVGPITVVGEVSRLYFDWGAAARKGSPMYDYQDELLTSNAAQEVSDCVES